MKKITALLVETTHAQAFTEFLPEQKWQFLEKNIPSTMWQKSLSLKFPPGEWMLYTSMLLVSSHRPWFREGLRSLSLPLQFFQGRGDVKQPLLPIPSPGWDHPVSGRHRKQGRRASCKLNVCMFLLSEVFLLVETAQIFPLVEMNTSSLPELCQVHFFRHTALVVIIHQVSRVTAQCSLEDKHNKKDWSRNRLTKILQYISLKNNILPKCKSKLDIAAASSYLICSDEYIQ